MSSGRSPRPTERPAPPPGTSVLGEHGAAYNVPLALRLTGSLDRDPLIQAFTDVVERHEVLRTGFLEVDGEPLPTGTRYRAGPARLPCAGERSGAADRGSRQRGTPCLRPCRRTPRPLLAVRAR
ncbi:condensation domain-containing protein [Streptomyces sp. GbtcB6]|uniref:condensation domain-containing protein n=1 Tax=Streptomyces sp. GbtcB6 TaxID=2824751 RepID=UPI0034D67CBD